ncbi:MAG: hypothetical protein M9894_11455 [Planctomycetes bacterium]|nr:hypothetical protein [Planctomycetota bacterium]
MRAAARRALGGLAALTFALGAARAEEPRPPVVHAVLLDGEPVTAAPAGSVLTLVGQDLHACPPLPEPAPGQPPPRNTCHHEELRVSLGGGAPCLVIASTAERLVFIVPQDAPLGPRRIVVDIRRRGRAAVNLEVVAPPRWPPPRTLPDEPIEVTSLEAVALETGTWLEVRGEAAWVGTGARLLVTVAFDGRPLQRREVPVQGGTYLARCGAFSGALPAGHYEVEVVFDLRRQRREVAASLRGGLREEDEERLWRLERRRSFRLGSEDAAARQQADLVEHYEALARSLTELAADLDRWQAAAPGDPDGFASWARQRLLPGLERAGAAEAAFAARFAVPLAPGAAAGVDRLRALLAGWALDLAARIDAPEDVRRVPGVEPAPAWTPRVGFEVERRLLLEAAAPR